MKIYRSDFLFETCIVYVDVYLLAVFFFTASVTYMYIYICWHITTTNCWSEEQCEITLHVAPCVHTEHKQNEEPLVKTLCHSATVGKNKQTKKKPSQGTFKIL